MSTGRLAGKRALVTGASTGIGDATARLFCAEGARVVGTGTTQASCAAAGARLPEVHWLPWDARDLGQLPALVERVRAQLSGLDVLFLNAGIAALQPFEALSPELYEAHMAVNVRGPLFLLHALLPLLASGASVLVTTSIAAHKAAPNMAVYAASKGALSAAVRTLAVELAPRGIRVNALSPGPTDTPIQGKFGLPPQLAQQVQQDTARKIPLGRFGEAQEVAQTALFLASSEASYLSGAELPVDGGLLYA